MSFLRSLARSQEMSRVGRRGIHCVGKICTDKVNRAILKETQSNVIDAALKLVRENAKLKKKLVDVFGGAPATATLLGVPLGNNSSFLQGSSFAPPYIREAIWSDSSNYTTEQGKVLTDSRVLADVGDIPVQELRDCGIDNDDLLEFVSNSVKEVMKEKTLLPLVLGGDHSISFPVVRAIYEELGGPVDVLHFDARPDFYRSVDGKYASPFARIKEKGYANRLVQVGIRSITEEESDQAKKYSNVEQYDMRTFAEKRQYLEKLSLGKDAKGVYISIDVGCLDPVFAPGVSHCQAGGLAFRDVMNILQNLEGNIVGGDVVEYNPKKDTADALTAKVAAKFVRELAAKMSK